MDKADSHKPEEPGAGDCVFKRHARKLGGSAGYESAGPEHRFECAPGAGARAVACQYRCAGQPGPISSEYNSGNSRCRDKAHPGGNARTTGSHFQPGPWRAAQCHAGEYPKPGSDREKFEIMSNGSVTSGAGSVLTFFANTDSKKM